MLKKFVLLLLFLTASAYHSYATHERAGDITFNHVSGYTYKISITTYTRISSPADRPSLDSVYYGDGLMGAFNRYDSFMVAPDIRVNYYYGYHTYPGPGIYVIHFEDPNRNADVVNIPNSVNVPFYVESKLVISPFIVPDNSPILTQPPIDFGCTNRVFVYNPGAFDADGDSLSYELAICKGAGGADINGYTYPSNYTTSSYTLNPVTGDMIWNTPNTPGAFNVAFKVFEWRKINGVRVNIGYVKRDMQIYIVTCNNEPPILDPVPPVCVLAGDTAKFTICARDPNGDKVELQAFGSTFLLSPDSSRFVQNNFNNDTVCGTYTWITSCPRVRTQPYSVIIKAADQYSTAFDSSLVDLQLVNIKVVGPPPVNPTATASNNSIVVTWQPGGCLNEIIGYKVYRRNGQYNGAIPCPCDNGVPSYTGYEFLAYVNGKFDTTYTDTDHGKGLVHGIDYCYLITAIFNTSDSTQSCASVQACAYLKKDVPVITNASDSITDVANGKMYVAWSKPTEYDTNVVKPPFEYRVYHSADFFGSSYSQIGTLTDINDTTLIDSLINNVDFPYSYKVEFYYDSSGTTLLAGKTETASSIYLKLSPTDRQVDLSWEEHVPWTNDSFIVYRLDPGATVYTAIDTTTLHTYSDKGLSNDSTYCYHVVGYGHYSAPGFITPIVNRSQDTCAKPLDNKPPCKPALTVIADCDRSLNELTWTVDRSCAADVAMYYIWFYNPVNPDYVLVDSIMNPSDTTYQHKNLVSNTGCYSIVAVDSSKLKNASPLEPFTCVDSCHQYYLPNVFTPDNDGINDFFHPCDQTTAKELQKICPPYKNVEDVNMKIYNRWGNLVFETTDRDINWDGKNKDSHKDCSEGVYYYVCEVHEIYLDGIRSHTITGIVQIIRKH